jgi:hypothetical protein
MYVHYPESKGATAFHVRFGFRLTEFFLFSFNVKTWNIIE